MDDGSRDKTLDVISTYVGKYPDCEEGVTVRGLRQHQNQGKGSAVKYGSLFSRGQYILFADADGATDYHEITKIYRIVKQAA